LTNLFREQIETDNFVDEFFNCIVEH
jgi:hypothetical protein